MCFCAHQNLWWCCGLNSVSVSVHSRDRQTKRVDMMKFLDTSLLAPLWDARGCSPDPPPLISAVDGGVQMSQLLICGDKPPKIDERHVLINAECLISVYREDYRRAASGGVASPLIMLLKTVPAEEMMKKKSIRDYLPLDIISKNVSCCSPLIEGPERKTMIIWEQPGDQSGDVLHDFQAQCLQPRY